MKVSLLARHLFAIALPTVVWLSVGAPVNAQTASIAQRGSGATVADTRPVKAAALAAEAVASRPEIAAPAFSLRAAHDRSIAMELPENWFYTAHSGNFDALAPLSQSGVVFKAFPVSARADSAEPGSRVLVSVYRPPQAFVHDVLAQYRFRSIRILGWQADEDAARRCSQLLRRDCEAAEVVARWTSPEGAECVGAFKIVNATPTSGGQWFSIVAGSWGSTTAIAADRPAIERVIRSIKSNDGIARTFLLDVLVQIRMLAGNRTYNYKLSESQLDALNRQEPIDGRPASAPASAQQR